MRIVHILLIIPVLVLGCEEPGTGGDMQDAEAGVTEDGSILDAQPGPDTGPPDAGEPPVGIQHDFCDRDLFVLPIGGVAEDVWGVSLWDAKLAYARGPKGGTVSDLFYLDLRSCLEFKLTTSARAIAPYVRKNRIIWYDHRYYVFSPESDYHCMDLYQYDLESWTETQLTDHPMCEWNPETNGRYVVYQRSMTTASGATRENILWDRVEDTEIQLVEPGGSAGYFDIMDRYVTWSAYTQLVGSLGKDVFYYDLVTGQQHHVESTADYYCYDVRLWDEYLTYACSEYWLDPPYHLFLYHIPTQQELHLDGQDIHTSGITHGAIHEGLVVWNTTKHMGIVGPFEVNSDIEVYDIEAGIQRRITTAPSRWRVSDIHYPFMLLGRSLGNYVYEYAVANLFALGVVDADGRLVAGDAVLEPPM